MPLTKGKIVDEVWYKQLERKAALCEEMAEALTHAARRNHQPASYCDACNKAEEVLAKYDKLKGGQ